MGDGLERDKEFIQELKEDIQTMDTKDFDKIKKMQIDYLIGNLKSAEKLYKCICCFVPSANGVNSSHDRLRCE